MSSTVTYYRPGGVPGIYAVQVTFDLQPSQWANVNIGRYRDRGYHCGSCGHQHPINPLQTETQRIERYAEFRDIWEQDTITVEIHERALGEEGPYQLIVYTATRIGINAKYLPCIRHGRIWQPNELHFNEIALIDAGASPRTPLLQAVEERAHREETDEGKGSAQHETNIYYVRNGFTAQGLLTLPVARPKREQHVLLPPHREEAMKQAALMN